MSSRTSIGTGCSHVEPVEAAPPARDWRDDPLEDEIPDSLDDIFDEDDGDVSEAFTQIRHVTPVAERHLPDHRAEFFPCPDFETFRPAFEELQAELEAGAREATAVSSREVIDVQEGGYFIRNGLLAYIAEKAEMTARGGKRDHRLRVIFSNGTESDPLISSFRKALAADPTARVIHRPGLGPLDPDWEADQLDLTGTIYVARSRSDQPAIAEVRDILLKIGVTTQDVQRRVADARNDPTFLLAPVDIVATYELQNLSRRKVEDLLHRFFDAARPRDLWITDRFGKQGLPARMVLCAARARQPGRRRDQERHPSRTPLRSRAAEDRPEMSGCAGLNLFCEIRRRAFTSNSFSKEFSSDGHRPHFHQAFIWTRRVSHQRRSNRLFSSHRQRWSGRFYDGHGGRGFR